MKESTRVGVLCVFLAIGGGCGSYPPKEWIPSPGEFRESGGSLVNSLKCSKIEEQGEIKKVIVEYFWHNKKYGEFHLEPPQGVTKTGFVGAGFVLSLAYQNSVQDRIMELWGLRIPTGGGWLVPPIGRPWVQLDEMWRLTPEAKWVQTGKPERVIMSVDFEKAKKQR